MHYFQSEDGKYILTREEIKELVSEAVADAMAKLSHPHTCRFVISDEDVKEASHAVGMVKDLGEGDIAKGIEAMRADHTWLRRQREVSYKVSYLIISILVMAIIGGLVKAVWEGFKHFLKVS